MKILCTILKRTYIILDVQIALKMIFSEAPNGATKSPKSYWFGIKFLSEWWYDDFLKILFTSALGDGVGHVPGHDKPNKSTIQTHSFSENKKLYESLKYAKSYGSLKLMKFSKFLHWNFNENENFRDRNFSKNFGLKKITYRFSFWPNFLSNEPFFIIFFKIHFRFPIFSPD